VNVKYTTIIWNKTIHKWKQEVTQEDYLILKKSQSLFE
jgi:hypothetical protein